MRLLKEPMTHFVALGALIFVVWSLTGRRQAGPAGPAPAPRARAIDVSGAQIDELRATFRAASKRDPSPAELGDLLEGFLSEEILFREGTARELDRDDRVVRRRVVEKMAALARPAAPSSDPSRDELLAWYRTYAHRFQRPVTVTLDQLFFDPKRHDDARAAAATALAPLAHGDAGAAPPPGVGDAGFLPTRMTAKSELELAHLFGEGFAQGAVAARPGRWEGPFASKHGQHLIRVVQRDPARMPPFAEVEKQVRADWLTQETRGLRAAAETLRPLYQVALPADRRAELAQSPALARFLQGGR
jgi:hypothetical protein